MLIYTSIPHTVRGVVLKLQQDKIYVLPYYLVSVSDVRVSGLDSISYGPLPSRLLDFMVLTILDEE
jgi:hypothetical protein